MLAKFGRANSLLSRARDGEEAHPVDQIKQVLSKTNFRGGDVLDRYKWPESEIPVNEHWVFEGQLSVNVSFPHALAQGSVMRHVFGATVQDRYVVMTEDAIYVSKRPSGVKMAPEEVRKLMHEKYIEDLFAKVSAMRTSFQR